MLFFSTKSIKYAYEKIISIIPFDDGIALQANRVNAKTTCYVGLDGLYVYNIVLNIKNINS